MNPRPPRCERGALPAELLPHLLAGKHSRRFVLALSIRGHPGLPLRLRRLGGRGSVRGSPRDESARLCPRFSYGGGTPGSAVRPGVGRFPSLRPPPSAPPPDVGAGNPPKAMKFFSTLPIIVLSVPPGSRGNALLARRQPKNTLPRRKRIGGKIVETSSLLRRESPLRTLCDPSRMCARKSLPGKGSRGIRRTRTAIPSTPKSRFSSIANRPHVIRGQRANIKKVYGIRYFPIDTEYAYF